MYIYIQNSKQGISAVLCQATNPLTSYRRWVLQYSLAVALFTKEYCCQAIVFPLDYCHRDSIPYSDSIPSYTKYINEVWGIY